MPNWVSSLIDNPWVVSIGTGLVVALILWAVRPVRRALARVFAAAWRWLKPSGLTRPPAFVVQPRWEMRHGQDPTYMELRNWGGTALRVRIRAEADDVFIAGDLDHERVERNGKVLIMVLPVAEKLWLTITCTDEAGEALVSRVPFVGKRASA